MSRPSLESRRKTMLFVMRVVLVTKRNDKSCMRQPIDRIESAG